MNPDTLVPVSMTASQWNAALMMLAEQPYRQSAQLIATIQQQLQRFEADGGHQHDLGRSPAAWKAAE
jgi:hypothetical protein